MVTRWTHLNLLLSIYSSYNYLLCLVLVVWFLFQANIVINTANNPTFMTASSAVQAIRGISPIHLSTAVSIRELWRQLDNVWAPESPKLMDNLETV